MVHKRVLKLRLEGHGNYLGRGEGCFIIKHKDKTEEKYPLFIKEIGECELRNQNSVSVGALISLAQWNIETLICDFNGLPVAVLKNLDDDSHVKTRIAQYEASKSIKGLEIAKQIIRFKIEGQNRVLIKYGYDPYKLESLQGNDRTRLLGIEGKHAQYYYPKIFELFPEKVRPERRETYKAYDGVNNIFNYGYQVLRWRIHRAILKAKLEPYLGFLHSTQFGKPSLVCDLQEIYRYLIDDFLIERCRTLHKNDFIMVEEIFMKTKGGKRVFLRHTEINELSEALNTFFDVTHRSLIDEEALRFTQYLRDESGEWNPNQPMI